MKNSNPKNNARRNAPSSEEDEPIRLPALDNSALVNRFRLTLVGRIFHYGGRSTEAFLALMPSAGIWDLEGRVRGFDLGNGRFHFNFESEEDLQKVLKKRPCHFNKWTFSLERWELNFQENLLCNVSFWIRIRGLPLRCWVERAFMEIGESLGHVVEVDETDAKILVAVDVTKPLRFKKKVVLDNGEEIQISLIYEKLHRYCFTCFMISHEERDCPHLNDRQRQINKDLRASAAALEFPRNDEVRQDRGRREITQRNSATHGEGAREPGRPRGLRSGSEASIERTSNVSRHDNPRTSRNVRRSLYPTNGTPHGESMRGSFWKRIGGERSYEPPRGRETSIHSSSGSRKRRETPPNRAIVESTYTSHRQDRRASPEPTRRREVPLRIRSPTREEPSLENWRNSRRPPRHQSIRSNEPRNPDQTLLDKGKGKMVVEEVESGNEQDDRETVNHVTVPYHFEVGSGSGSQPPTNNDADPSRPVVNPPSPIREEIPMVGNDFATALPKEATIAEDVWGSPDRNVMENETAVDDCILGDGTIPSDWENLVDNESDKEITEEQLQILAELEKEMILDGFLDEDDLLGEELMNMETVEDGIEEDSQERTISEQVRPVRRGTSAVASPSPTSKRLRSPSVEARRRNGSGSERAEASPPRFAIGSTFSPKKPRSSEPNKINEPKKLIPRSPKVNVNASRKLKNFQPKSPPKKKAGDGGHNMIPHPEENPNTKKKATKKTKSKDGPAESRISPDPPK